MKKITKHRGVTPWHCYSAFVVFVLFAAGFSFGGVRLWVKPKEAIERVAGTGMSAHDAAPVHPSLLFHDLVKRLGNLVPASPKDVTVMQRRLIRAGYRNPNALKVLYGAKAIFAVLLPVVMTRRGASIPRPSRATKLRRFWWRWRSDSSVPTNTCAWRPSAAKSRSSAGWPIRWT